MAIIVICGFGIDFKESGERGLDVRSERAVCRPEMPAPRMSIFFVLGVVVDDDDDMVRLVLVFEFEFDAEGDGDGISRASFAGSESESESGAVRIGCKCGLIRMILYTLILYLV